MSSCAIAPEHANLLVPVHWILTQQVYGCIWSVTCLSNRSAVRRVSHRSLRSSAAAGGPPPSAAHTAASSRACLFAQASCLDTFWPWLAGGSCGAAAASQVPTRVAGTAASAAGAAVAAAAAAESPAAAAAELPAAAAAAASACVSASASASASCCWRGAARSLSPCECSVACLVYHRNRYRWAVQDNVSSEMH